MLNGCQKETTTRPVTRKNHYPLHFDRLKITLRQLRFAINLSRLYFGKSRLAQQFRYGLLVFDVVTIAFIVGTSFLARTTGSNGSM